MYTYRTNPKATTKTRVHIKIPNTQPLVIMTTGQDRHSLIDPS